MNDKLAKLRARLKQQENGSKNRDSYFNPYDLPDGSIVSVRILPLKDDDLAWSVQHVYHVLPGDTTGKKYTCRRDHLGEDCPFCEKAIKYYSENNDDMGYRYWKRRRYYSNVIIRPTDAIQNFEELKMPLIWSYGKTINEILKAGVMDDDIGIFFDLEDGLDFKLHKNTKGEWPTYEGSTFARKNTPACSSSEELEKVLDGMHDLNALIPEPLSYEKLEALISGKAPAKSSPFKEEPKAVEAEEKSTTPTDEGPSVKPAKMADEEPKVEEKSTAADSSDDEEAEIAALLAKIKKNA